MAWCKFIVYRHKNKVNGKSYVGWAKIAKHKTPEDTMMRRWARHVFDAEHGSNRVFHNAIRKYGILAFDHELLEVMSTHKGVMHAEVLWIEQLKTFFYDHPNFGYNMTKGGDGDRQNHVATEESHERRSAAQRGKKASDETRIKMSLSRVGRKKNAQWREKIRVSNTSEKQPHFILIRSVITKCHLLKVQQLPLRTIANILGISITSVRRALKLQPWYPACG